MGIARALLVLLCAGLLAPRDEIPRVVHELPADLKTIETLKAFEPKAGGAQKLRPALGIRFGAFRRAGAEIAAVEPGSPAAEAGLRKGDLVRQLGRQRLSEMEDLENALSALRIGSGVQLFVKRPAEKREVKVELGSGELAGDPGFEYRHRQGHFEITAVRDGSAAARAGLAPGDCFTEVDQRLYTGATQLRRALKDKRFFTLLLEREEQSLVVTAKPVGAKQEEVVDWKGKTFRLAVLLVEFSDRKHNPSYQSADFERLLFSRNEYKQSPDGRATYGSLRDYYQEMSVGTFDVQGKVLDWVCVPEGWAYYDAQDMGGGAPGTRTIFQDALEAARRKHGAHALDAFDGVVFLYAGERQSLRGSQLWPHRASVEVGGRSLPYYIIAEGGASFGSIGVHCHEFGHMLGLPDFYGYGHRTGVGEFCVMAIGHLGAAPSGPDRPFHLCAWCKLRLGWLTARTVLPSEKQHLVLRGIENRAGEALKILLSPTGEEYYLLEVRNRIGFDADFFRPGLLIWHVGDDDARERQQISVPIDLVEAHGKRYFDASLREESEILFPNARLSAFTPLTVPGSGSDTAGAYEVDLTDIQIYQPDAPSTDARVPSGSVLLWIGDRARAAQQKGEAPEQPRYPREPVQELDPVTELPVPFTVDEQGVAAPGPAIAPRDKPGGASSKPDPPGSLR